jgi:polyisoprenoid-binding protein YceI
VRPNGLVRHLIELKGKSHSNRREAQNQIARRMTMKTLGSRNLHFVTGKIRLALAFLLVLTVSLSIPAHAQEAWRLDSQLSIARLSLGSGANALEIGLARVSGDVVFDSNDPTDPSVNLEITPGDDTGAEYARMSFTSKRSVMASDGELIVTGDLSVTRIERSVTAEPNEAYAGPQYGDPVAHTDTRQIVLAFDDLRQLAAHGGTLLFSGTTSAVREDFPQLLDALTLDDWPTALVNDKKCEAPSTIGEDYSGMKCTGTEIAEVSNTEVPTGVGEGYYGFQPAVTPDRNHATIALNLRLTQMAATASVGSKAVDSAGH